VSLLVSVLFDFTRMTHLLRRMKRPGTQRNAAMKKLIAPFLVLALAALPPRRAR